MNKAIYAGSFDPITNGHMDIIERAAKMFDELIVAVATNTSKKSMFSFDEKLFACQNAIEQAGFENVSVIRLEDMLIVDFAKKLGVKTLIRGLRSAKDFEYEIEIDTLNKVLNSDIETIYLAASAETRAISSSIVREIATFNGDLSQLVPQSVIEILKEK